MPRTSPFDLAFDPLAEERFPAIREELAREGRDARDRDAFLVTPAAVQLIRDLRPGEGVGEAIDQLVAFVHHAYVFWDAGKPAGAIMADQVQPLLNAHPPEAPADALGTDALYVQYPERRIWGQVLEGEPHEPLDGCFLHTDMAGGLRVLGIFGMHRERDGFSVVEAAGPRQPNLARPDGSPLFSPVMPGGDAAGLHSIAGGEELLELGWRSRGVAVAPVG
jgi:hypothetical protein